MVNVLFCLLLCFLWCSGSSGRVAIKEEEQNLLRQYLLGELSDAAEEQVEVRLLADDAFFEELELVENELMDQYVRNSLTSDERAKLEKRLLRDAGQQQRLGFARALSLESDQRAADRQKVVPLVRPPVKKPFANPYLRIAAGLIVAAGLG